MTEIVVASGNRGKLAELARTLAPLGVTLRPQDEFGVPEVAETGLSFIENAILKARAAAAHTGLPAIADDSGLAVDALGGAPGIYSARYARMAGAGEGDAANNARLLEALAGVPAAGRTAHFHCALVYLRRSDDPTPVIAEGRWPGSIRTAASGGGGFGYDPLFQPEGLAVSAAELPAEEKNRLSHRARASAALLAALQATDAAP
ncbi:RdgB/HAM1 family non-canonical purine NTP pyrophosphatase [Pseudohaliea rubra]|uniref:dITP/XTP pyrophosphatase n=1 Tax=Pseudohaliea rubra DSM 19751 TaxID=1265313 RepID=A0A095VT00_9GAMM|nr:RdgB/HAM1 family non-canonical purine NTP pyrophosphatase [Pseudohaliea rubra]KGE04198.1 Nucleoside 5-triphosphatase RdgB (dHAPTP, dITP, XTP-specific) [Pseudohaliea rubra DSM 19751]